MNSQGQHGATTGGPRAPGAIVVGVDGSPAATVALRWAVAEATRRHLPIHLIAASYVDPFSYPGGADLLPVMVEAAQEHATRALDQAREIVGAQCAVAVTTESASARPVDALVSAADDAAMIVVGRAGPESARWPRTGSVAVGLLPITPVPVVVVPPDHAGGGQGPVVVGVAGWPSDERVLSHALTEASFRGVPLRAVHAWGDRTLRTALRTSEGQVRDLTDAAWHGEMRVLAESLAGWREKYPDVVVETLIPHDDPADAMLEVSDDASLIVIGSRGHGAAMSFLLGSTCRSVIPHAPAPVMVIPREP